MIESRSILLSIGFLHRRRFYKVVRQQMTQYGLRPLDLLHDGVVDSDQSQLAAALKLMSKADGYLTVIDTQYIMKPDKSDAERLRLEFDRAVANNL